jgi:hypothetical protein
MAGKIPVYDIQIAAFLELHSVQLSLAKDQDTGRVIFEAPASDEVYRILSLYENDTKVGVKTFAGYLKNLRGRMLAIRNGEGERRNGGHNGTSTHTG